MVRDELQAGRKPPWCQILQRRHLEWILQRENIKFTRALVTEWKQFQESNESVMHGKGQQIHNRCYISEKEKWSKPVTYGYSFVLADSLTLR